MKKSIQKKVMKTTILLSFVTMLLVSIFFFLGIRYLSAMVVRSSQEFGATTSARSEEALVQQSLEHIRVVAKFNAELCDEKTRKIEDNVRLMGGMVKTQYEGKETAGQRLIVPPDPANEGRVASQLLLSEGLPTANIAQELALLSDLDAFLVEMYAANPNCFAVYVSTESGFTLLADDASGTNPLYYDARERNWYQQAKASGELIWSDVYEDLFTGKPSITCAAPLYANGQFAGVTGISLYLEALAPALNNDDVGNEGYSFIMNQYGDAVISSKSEGDSIFSGGLAQPGGEETEFDAEVVEPLPGEEAGGKENATVTIVEFQGEKVLLAMQPLSVLPWVSGAVLSYEEVVATAVETAKEIELMSANTQNELQGRIRLIVLVLIASFAVVLLGTLAVGVYLSKKLSAPIRQLSEGAQTIAQGDIDYQFNLKTDDEVEALANTFNQMIDKLKAITAEKERIGTELDVATKIQSSMLPCIFPAFPNRKEFEIYAFMVPAKEVGGDFYDFFLVDEDHLCLVMADVSGKGVPAALFMVIAKTLIKNSALTGKSPQDIFGTVNNQLCENNDSSMFVTAFVGILEIGTGRFTYANAGHNLPLLKRAGGDFAFLKTDSSTVLGFMEDIDYRQEEMVLAAGDMLFTYTDGVTEAVDTDFTLFSDKGLLEAANRHKHCRVEGLLNHIQQDLALFTQGTQQQDDITMMALEISRSAQAASLRVEASLEHFEKMVNFVETWLAGFGATSKATNQILLAVEEVFVNVANYAYTPKTGPISLTLEEEKGVVRLMFEDWGVPFNPLLPKAPNLLLALEDRQAGGLGIFLTKNTMNQISYEYKDQKNRLVMEKTIWEKGEEL